MAQKHVDPVDPDPQHYFQGGAFSVCYLLRAGLRRSAFSAPASVWRTPRTNLRVGTRLLYLHMCSPNNTMFAYFSLSLFILGHKWIGVIFHPLTRVADSYSFDTDPDPAFRVNTDPDPIWIQGLWWPKIIYSWKNPIKDVQVTKEAFSSQKRTSSTSKHEMTDG